MVCCVTVLYTLCYRFDFIFNDLVILIMRKVLLIFLLGLIMVSCDSSRKEPKRYENCKVIRLELKQDFTNFVWDGQIAFTDGVDTVYSRIHYQDAVELHKDLLANKNSVTLEKIGNTVYYKK